jgi:hypothetical protein
MKNSILIALISAIAAAGCHHGTDVPVATIGRAAHQAFANCRLVDGVSMDRNYCSHGVEFAMQIARSNPIRNTEDATRLIAEAYEGCGRISGSDPYYEQSCGAGVAYFRDAYIALIPEALDELRARASMMQ